MFSQLSGRALAGAILILILYPAAGCGSAGGGTTTTASDTASLAEVSANLPRPDVPLIVNDQSSAEENAGAGGGSGTAGSAAGNTTITITPNTGSASGGAMRRFLWKPVSEGDGNVVVLVDSRNVRVEVFGSISETLTDFGPSNGRGTTARGSFAGCDYGSNIRVQFFNRSGQRLGFVNGDNQVIIPNGCDRVEFDL